ncbi:hypothetical protein GOV04_04820 [Candidatus Woesearchaeota archaeon]|nr:hypothetical protein [Candidatus Woesearchaeota archaeon]
MKKTTIVITSILVLLFMLGGCTRYPAEKVTGDFCDPQTGLCYTLIPVENQTLEQTEELEPVELTEVEISQLASVATLQINETGTLKIVPEAFDPDGDPLLYIYSEPLDASGQWRTINGDAGEYNITITVSDGELTNTKLITLIVSEVNFEPIIVTSLPSETDLQMAETQTLDFGVSAEDPDGDEVSVQWYLDDELKVIGEVFFYETDYQSAGEHIIKVEISDGELTAQNSWSVIVEQTNRAPELDFIDDVTVDETGTVSITPNAIDADSDELVYSISEPVGDDGAWETSFEDAGQYTVTITATDGDSTDTQAILLTVNNVNRAPVLEDLQDLTIEETQAVLIEPSASDPDGDEVVYAVSEPVGDDGVWETSFEDSGSYEVIVAVSDGADVVEKSFVLTVTNKNRAPTLDAIEDITVDETGTISITPNAIDSDGDELSFTISEPVGDDGAWETSFEDAGQYTVTVTVSDGELTDSQPVLVTVNNVNRAPVITGVFQE